MKTTPDPIIDRVRAARMKLSAECGNDLHQIAEMSKRSHEKWTARQKSLHAASGKK